MDSSGTLVFDVNDFDEAYLGSFTWDLTRLAASVALLAWSKSISDADIAALIGGTAGELSGVAGSGIAGVVLQRVEQSMLTPRVR